MTGTDVVVNKFAYRLGDTRRGDIVVFDTGQVASTHQLGSTLVKRVIGKPGDEIQAVDGRVLVNGEPLDGALVARRRDTIVRSGAGARGLAVPPG